MIQEPQWVQRGLRRLSWVALVGAVACGPTNSPTEPDGVLEGTFALRQLNGHSVPGPYIAGWDITRGYIIFFPNGTYEFGYHYVSVSPPFEVDDGHVGTFSVTGSIVTLARDGNLQKIIQATRSGNGVTFLEYHAVTWSFERCEPSEGCTIQRAP